ncbi:hypothetical protein PPERSA_00775 [Pseudocohnilembus persalinus]|uniref:DBF4-type domain-containing protein n=1 Tax=Pseudocohnilembus persalinus TaxID=266149 RepID=A0A0V0QA56_PSEPJ|nr:hypothetical protein PPERSA_00775 [Pseudocohnilembus persalinus]|eukprot:KRW98948.1 hypothetical protein PPERSA_00775 [Pseudocohnilembus persalinus]
MTPKQQNKNSTKTRRKNTQVKCRANCAQHKFIFKPKAEKQYHQKATIQYCPVRCDQDKVENVIPQINPDGKKYYPLFWIDLDKDHYKQHEEKYKDEHEKKVLDYMQEKEELYEPKPGRKTRWCAVCKLQYNDYLEHVSKKEHSNHLMNNKFIEEINKIAEQYPYKKRQEYTSLQVKTTSEEISNKENISTTLENNDIESENIQLENTTKQKSAKQNSQQTQDITLKHNYQQQQQLQQKNAPYLNNSEIIFPDYNQKQQQQFQSNTQQQQQQNYNIYPTNSNASNFQKQSFIPQSQQQQQYQIIQNQCNPGVFQQSNNSPTVLQNASIQNNNNTNGNLVMSQHNQSDNLSYQSQFKQSKKRNLSQINHLSLHQSGNLEQIKKQQKQQIIDLTQDDNNEYNTQIIPQQQQQSQIQQQQQQQQQYTYNQEAYFNQQGQCAVKSLQQIQQLPQQETQFQPNNQNHLIQNKLYLNNQGSMMPINQDFNARWQNPDTNTNQFNNKLTMYQKSPFAPQYQQQQLQQQFKC